MSIEVGRSAGFCSPKTQPRRDGFVALRWPTSPEGFYDTIGPSFCIVMLTHMLACLNFPCMFIPCLTECESESKNEENRDCG